jgi:hypothetical protein
MDLDTIRQILLTRVVLKEPHPIKINKVILFVVNTKNEISNIE